MSIRLAHYLPENILSNADLAAEFPGWNYEEFESKVGIKQRHIALPGETALDLAEKASLRVLEGYDKSLIDYVILCTQSPDYYLPTSACILQNRLGLNKHCGAIDFNLGCSGYVYGLSLAKGLLAANVASNILFVTAETYSKFIHPKDRTNRAIFGDAGAATILTKEESAEIGAFCLGSDGSGAEKLIVKNGASKSPYDVQADEIVYGTDNVYTDNNLYMNGPDIFTFTLENIPQLVTDTLEKNSLGIDDVDLFIFHQANAFMLNFLRKKIRIPKEKFFIELNNTGNTVSCTIPIALEQAIEKGLVKKGDKIFLAGFGVGLSWGATVITY